MKRFYSTLAMGAMICGTAFAVTPMNGVEKTAQTLTKELTCQPQNQTSLSKIKGNGPAKAISSVADLEGYYNFVGYNYITDGEEAEYFAGIVECKATGNGNEVVFPGFLGYGDIYATVDLAKSEITFLPNPEFFYASYYGQYAQFELGSWNDDGQGFYTVDSYTASIEADGSILFPWQALLIAAMHNFFDPDSGEMIPDGYFFALSSAADNMQFEVYEMWEFDSSEWTIGGNALFQDGWIAPLMGLNIGGEYGDYIYEIPYYVNKNNQNIILLDNPYGPGSIWADEDSFVEEDRPYVLNISKNKGYIYINASNPDCVIVKGPVYSGYESEMYGKFFMWDLAGFYAYTYGEQYVDQFMNYYRDPKSTKVGDFINIAACYFGAQGDPTGQYYFGVNAPSPANIQLDGAGVEGIASDVNAPVKYYNLQGVEIQNPEKGQIVIKKQGSTTSKYVAR